MRAMPSSPRSSTMSVAPNCLASAWRSVCRDIAMMRSAPICCAAKIPMRPTAPSPTTATVFPGPTAAASAANQPVPKTSDAASKLLVCSSVGVPGTLTRVPSASGMRAFSACVPMPPIMTWWAQRDWKPASQISQVLSDATKEPTTKSPMATDDTSSPICSTMPMYSCPMGWRSTSSVPR